MTVFQPDYCHGRSRDIGADFHNGYLVDSTNESRRTWDNDSRITTGNGMASEERQLALSNETPRVFQRSTWQNIVRWLAFLLVLALNVACITATVSTIATHGFQAMRALKGLVAYVLLLLGNAVLLPSILFEARRIEVFADRMVIYNLIYKSTVQWSDITGVIAPIYLKFAVIKTQKFFHLINKRDVERFSDLIQIIRDKTTGLTPS